MHPKLPTERQWVTIWVFGLTLILLGMAAYNPKLWEVEVFKVIIQAVVLTGVLNMILAFHFAANKSDEDKTINTGKMADAIKATAEANKPIKTEPDMILEDGETATIEASRSEKE